MACRLRMPADHLLAVLIWWAIAAWSGAGYWWGYGHWWGAAPAP
jgi:hypothetical protein